MSYSKTKLLIKATELRNFLTETFRQWRKKIRMLMSFMSETIKLVFQISRSTSLAEHNEGEALLVLIPSHHYSQRDSALLESKGFSRCGLCKASGL